MGKLKKAIEEFRKEQLYIYKKSDRQSRDLSVANRAAKDHVERWLLELLQNSDDAQANAVKIQVDNRAIYVADNGNGLVASAVRAISGTDFSDKLSGTIGRKGIGFKAVYTVSDSPQVFSINGEGLEFSRERAKEWLRKNKLPDEKNPYQWLPFFVSRDHAESNDEILAGLREFSTIVKLPTRSSSGNLDLLETFPSYGLIPFSHVRKLEVQSYESLNYTLEVTKKDDGTWTVYDSRKDKSVSWCVRKNSIRPPDNILQTLNEDERVRIEKDGISLLVATTLDEDGIVRSLNEFLPIYVFYPAERDLAPVRVLLHAEFLVKSDRTALTPIKEGNFNDWVAEKLAEFFINFVQGTYSQDDPAAYLRLLVPLKLRDNDHVANIIWEKIAKCAKDGLRLPDVNGRLNISLADARLLNVSVEPGKARQILEGTDNATVLLNKALDSDNEAQSAMKALKCRNITDKDLLEIIKDTAPQKPDDHDWIWACWEWVAAWVHPRLISLEQKQRFERSKDLPLIPISGTIWPMSSLGEKIITWRREETLGNQPDWLPISFVDDWFRDKLIRTTKDDNDRVGKFRKKLGIQNPNDDMLLKSLVAAIEKYWENPNGNPERFIKFILAHDWPVTHDSLEGLRRCPIPADVEGDREIHFTEAQKNIFWRGLGRKTNRRTIQGN